MTLRELGDRILYGVLTGLITALVIAAISALAGEGLPLSRVLIGIVLAVVVVSVGIAMLVRKALEELLVKYVRPRLEKEVTPVLEAHVRQTINDEIGIVRTFPNFPACEQEVLDSIDRSRDVRIFLQIGKTVLSGATGIYDYLAKANLRSGASVRVLHASPDNPYLSERVAAVRESDYANWIADLENARKKLGTLMSKAGARVEGREHLEGFLWRLFICDDIAYVQPYLYKRDNSTQAPVIKVSARGHDATTANPNSLFHCVSEYFEQKWSENTPRITTLEDLIPTGSVTAVAVVAKYHQFYVFVVPKRYADRPSAEVPFHAIGGKLKDGEDWIVGLRREVREEVGVEIEVESCQQTRYLTSGLEIEAIHVKDEPRPYCIYKRSREADPNFAHAEVLWLIGYRGQITLKGFLKPQSEAAALVYLTGDALRHCVHGKVSYRQINAIGDGSRVILANSSFDLDRRAVPTGLALIAGAAQIPRVLQRL